MLAIFHQTVYNKHMKITKKQFKLIEPYLPKQRGNVEIDNLTFINALLYIIENGCKWRAIPKEFGNWHTIYMRFNRWSKSGVIERLFAALQNQGIIEIRTEIVHLDSTSIKVHPDGTGARKVSGEQAIGRSKGDSQPRFIWLPVLPNQPYISF
jgi:transposase